MAAKLRKGDEVIVLTGKDKGKKGKILKHRVSKSLPYLITCDESINNKSPVFN